MYPKRNVFNELLKKNNYNDNIVALVKSKIFPNDNQLDRQYFTNLINKINFIGDDACKEFEKEITKILKETNNYNESKDLYDLISKVANKNITFHKNHLNLSKIDYKPTFNISKNGLSDAYHVYKLKEIIEKNKPEFDNLSIVVDEIEKSCVKKKKFTLKEYDMLWKEVFDEWKVFDN